MMKLLTKNEIEKQKGIERKMEIDEGAKLARKVDALREITAKESVERDKFRLASLEKIRTEITDATKERDDILAEIETLKTRRAVLMEPLDAEWARIRNREQKVVDIEKEIESKKALLNKKEEELTARQEALATAERRISQAETLANDNLRKTSAERQEAQTTLAKAQDVRKEADQYHADRTQDVASREAEVAVRERVVAIKQAQIIEDRKELEDRERAVNDKYETLLRTIKRINHG